MALRCLLLLLLALPLSQAAEKTVAVVTVHPLSTKAAEQAFKQGGNAVDAIVAAALTLGVVDGFNSGIGGGCFMLIHKPDGTFVAIDGRDTRLRPPRSPASLPPRLPMAACDAESFNRLRSSTG